MKPFVVFFTLMMLALFGFASGVSAAPVVTNVRAAQRTDSSGLVDITYDLSSPDGSTTISTVSVLVSPDSGATWPIRASSNFLSGDVGEGIENGVDHQIVWDAAADRPEVLWPNCRIRVRALGGFGSDEITILLPGGAPLILVRIPEGSFQMGSPDTERSRWDDEGPVHTVNIGYDFYMGKTEVTQRQWLAVMGSWPSAAPSSSYGVGDNYPAYDISWNDAKNFITALNTHVANTGQGPLTVRLPSEAEWEYACRAGTQTRFYFGDSLGVSGDYCEDGAAGTLPGNRSDYMWYCGNNSPYGSKPVGTKLPNALGLYDMSGNLWEWCEDWRHGSYTGAPADGSAWVFPVASYRVLRGGRWDGDAWLCRSSFRGGIPPDFRGTYVGFRLAAVQQVLPVEPSRASQAGKKR